MPSGFLFTFEAVHFDRAQEEMKNFLALEYYNQTEDRRIFEYFKDFFEFKKIIKNVILVKNLCQIRNIFLFYAKTKEHKFKRILKITPLEILISNNYMEKIMQFFQDKNIAGSYKIVYKKRISDLNLKEDIFNYITEKLKDNKVNLCNPENKIVIEVNRKIIGISIIKN